MQINENRAQIIPKIKQIVKYLSVVSFILIRIAPAIPAIIETKVKINKGMLS